MNTVVECRYRADYGNRISSAIKSGCLDIHEGSGVPEIGVESPGIAGMQSFFEIPGILTG